LEIRGARYEAQDGSRGADVTARVREIVESGQYTIEASNGLFGDTVPNVVKRLRVEYAIDGKPMEKIVNENETLELAEEPQSASMAPFDVAADPAGITVTRWTRTPLEFRTSDGRTQRIDAAEEPRSLEIAGSWSLAFPKGW